MTEPNQKRQADCSLDREDRKCSIQQNSCDSGSRSTLDLEAVRVELVCNICLDLPSHVATILPCLHSFCWSCIEHWFRGHHKCPRCSQPASSARSNAALNNLVQAVIAADSTLAKPAELIEKERERLDKYKQRSGFNAALYPTGGDVSEEDEEESDMEPEDIPRYWPCPCCAPGHWSGYICPNPVPLPPGGIPGPVRGGDFPTLLEAAEYLPGVIIDSHRECYSCGRWLPRDGLRETQCAGCSCYCCSHLDTEGDCPTSPDFGSMDIHGFFGIDIDPILVHSTLNTVEKARVRDYMNDHNISVHHIYMAMMQRAENLNAEEVPADETVRLDNAVDSRVSDDNHVAEDVRLALYGEAATEPDVQEASDEGRPQGGAEAANAGHPRDNVDTIDQPGPQAARRTHQSPAARISQEAGKCLAQGCRVGGTPLCHPFDLDRASALLSAPYCGRCANSVMSHLIEWWWLEIWSEHPDRLPAHIRGLSKCLYGIHCRSQRTDSAHAEKYNHFCEQTIFPQPNEPEPRVDGAA